MEIDQIKTTLLKCGIQKGDTLLLHGDAGIAEQLKSNKKDKINLFFDILTEHIGKKGNILVPTFTYSACKKKIFDEKKSSSEIGLLSEIFRQRKLIRRTNHPIFSFAIYGKKFKYYDNASIETCFGSDSIFDRFFKSKGKIVCLGCDLDRVTFTHYVEEFYKVKYRYIKNFNIFSKKLNKYIKTSYFVRKLSKKSRIDLRKLHEYLKKKKRIQESNFGRYRMLSIKSEIFFKSCIEVLKKDKNFLIEKNN